MNWVGIHNFSEKTRLMAECTPRLATLPVAQLSYDCTRHIRFLEFVASGSRTGPLEDTLYWQYQRLRGRSEEAIRNRCNGFIALYDCVLQNGYDQEGNRPSVAEGGARLDGSHRAAIATFLCLPSIEVNVYRWDDLRLNGRVAHVAEEVRFKVQNQERYKGCGIYDPATGRRLAAFEFVDVELKPKRRLGMRRGYCLNRLVVGRTTDGPLQSYRLDRVLLR